MRKVLLPLLLCLGATLSYPAEAQDAAFYDCQNYRIRLTIAPMRLDEAIAKFTSATRCPVSIDTDVVNGRKTRTMRTALAKGRFTPEQALMRMLRTTPLKATPIHGGFSVSK